jgi:hypothetical protein
VAALKKANGLRVKVPIVQEKAPEGLRYGWQSRTKANRHLQFFQHLEVPDIFLLGRGAEGLIFQRTFVNVPFKSAKPQGIR